MTRCFHRQQSKQKEKKMKKLIIFAVMSACGVAAQAKKTTISDGCMFCNGGETVIEDDPVIVTPPPSSGCVFCGGGSSSSGGSWSSTDWSKAMTKQTYIVDEDGGYAGLATITTSKQSKKGKVSVKIVFKLSTGKSVTASKTSFTPDEDGTITATWSSIKNLGAVEMAITSEGEVSGTAGTYEFADEYETGDDDDGGTFVHGLHTFSVEADDYEMPNEDYDLILETIPELEIATSNAKSWNCGKAPSIKYKKFKEDGETWYELVGFDDESKTNYSGLKLKYNAKKGTFSGSFTVYATNEGSTEKKPKLKKYKFSVSGRISGGEATGVATCKKLKANWPVVID